MPQAMPVSRTSEAAAMHSGGYTTHHQFCPAASPMSTRKAMYSPAGSRKPSYAFNGNSAGSSRASTLSLQAFSRRISSAMLLICGSASRKALLASSRLADARMVCSVNASTLSRTCNFSV